MAANDIKELTALVSLVDEPDETIFEGIASKIHSYGADAIAVLLEKAENSFEPFILKRLQEMVHEIQFETLCRDFENIEELDISQLFDLCLRLARLEYFDLDEAVVMKKTKNIIRDAWIMVNDKMPAHEKIKILNEVIYEKQGFSGNDDNLHDVKNAFINSLLDTGKGSPISLGILYIFIAQHLNIPVYGVNLPEQFILAYLDETEEGKTKLPKEKDVLFYINPFFKGAIFSKKEVERYLMDIKAEPLEKYFLPCSNLDILKRFTSNLIYDYANINEQNKANELAMLLDILQKGDMT